MAVPSLRYATGLHIPLPPGSCARSSPFSLRSNIRRPSLPAPAGKQSSGRAAPPATSSARLLAMPGRADAFVVALPAMSKGISPLRNPPLPEETTYGFLLPVRKAHGTQRPEPCFAPVHGLLFPCEAVRAPMTSGDFPEVVTDRRMERGCKRFPPEGPPSTPGLRPGRPRPRRLRRRGKTRARRAARLVFP